METKFILLPLETMVLIYTFTQNYNDFQNHCQNSKGFIHTVTLHVIEILISGDLSFQIKSSKFEIRIQSLDPSSV
jgi:hypothetical protein